MESKSNYRYTEELIEAVLANHDVGDAAKQLMARKKEEYSNYCSGIEEEKNTLELLIKSLSMPAGSAGKVLADAMMAQLKENYPAAAKKADEHMAVKAKLEAAETMSLSSK